MACGAVVSAFGFAVLAEIAPPSPQGLILAALIGLGALWFLIGVSTWIGLVWALRAGLILSYPVLLLPVVIHAHRVLRWVKEMEARGIPLNTRLW